MKKTIITMFIFTLVCQQAKSASPDWASWILQKVQNNPRIQSTQYTASAADYRASSMAKPLYNPSLETEIEREGDAFNYRIGLATDIDWWNQQGIRAKLGNKQIILAQLQLQSATNSMLSEAIKAQISYELTEKNYRFAKAQVEQDISLLTLVKAEVEAGEASLIDVAILNAISGENIVAENSAFLAYLQAQNQVEILLGRQLSPPDINRDFWQVPVTLLDMASLQQLPTMQLGYNQWLQAQQEVELIVAIAKPSPSVAMNIGEQDGTTTVAMSMSVPLTFRNNYQDDADEARQLALAAELQFRSDMNELQNTLRQTVLYLNVLKQRYTQWLNSSGDAFTSQSDNLTKRFRSGDLSIADYQVLIQQLRSGMQARIVIEETFKLSYVDYLATSGQLTPLLQRLATQDIQP